MTVGYLNTRTNTIRNIVIDYYDAYFHLTDQIVAVSGVWEPAGWLLTNGVHRTFVGGDWKEDYFADWRLSLSLKPGDLVIKRLRPEQMTGREFRTYIRQFETLGIPADKEHIQYYLRFSSAFSHIIVMLIGIPFALGLAGKHGKILSFTFALLFAFVYWGVQAVGQSLGENRIISPFFAAWVGNILFGFAGVYLVSKIQK
jgi:lipopolysaccharide export LptBFGC system permease protein LptF